MRTHDATDGAGDDDARATPVSHVDATTASTAATASASRTHTPRSNGNESEKCAQRSSSSSSSSRKAKQRAAATRAARRDTASTTRHARPSRSCRRSPSVLLAMLLCAVVCVLLAMQLYTRPHRAHEHSDDVVGSATVRPRKPAAATSAQSPPTPAAPPVAQPPQPGACSGRMQHLTATDDRSDAHTATDRATTVGDDVVVEALPDGCRVPYCAAAAFGTVLGAHDDVLAFSNCYSKTCFSYVENRVLVRVPRASAATATANTNNDTNVDNRNDSSSSSSSAVATMFSGMKWQCVEYARRYWLLRGRPSPATFGDVDGAIDIWTQLREATLLNGTRVPLRKHSNGVDLVHGGSAPRVADLVIYTRDSDTMPYGHVAVVVGVDFVTGRVYIAEQNWDSGVWPAPHHNYSRTLPMHYDAATSRYTLDDPPYTIAGWYRHRMWHIEDATLSIAVPRLELLVDFDAPSRFARVPNGPLHHGIHPAHTPPPPTGTSLAGGGSSGSSSGGGARRGVMRQPLTAFGRISGPLLCGGDDALVTQWRELGVPALSDTS